MTELVATVTLGQLVVGKCAVISVPDTATVGASLKIMQDQNLLALPVTAPKGKWLGAGGSMVIEGNIQYIGIVSMTDFVMHIGDKGTALEAALAEPVTNLIGNTSEGMSLWVMSAKMLLLEALEPMSKGVHRILVAASSPDSSAHNAQVQAPKLYLLTQTDVVRFLLQNLDAFGQDLSRPIQDLGLVYPSLPPVSVRATTTVLDALRFMRQAGGVSAVAVVVPLEEEQGAEASQGGAAGEPKWGRVVATLSASDFRGLDGRMMWQLSQVQVMDFLKQMSGVGVPRPPVTCRPSAPLAEVMANAITSKVHRVWVTSEAGSLLGVVTFTDMIKAARHVLLASVAAS